MKILIIAQQFFPDSVGGAARVAFEQARELVSRGHSVAVVAPKCRAELGDFEIIEKIDVFRYGNGKIHPFGQSYVDVTKSGKKIIEVIEVFKPEIVIAHQPTVCYAFLKKNIDIPLIYVFHASIPKEVEFQGLTGKGAWKRLFGWMFVKWLRELEEYSLSRAKKIIVLSQYSKGLIKRYYPNYFNKTDVIPTGVDTDRFKPAFSKQKTRAIIGIPEEKTVLLTVRRLVPRMGLLNLVDVIPEIAKENKDIRLYIVGEGPLKNKIQKRINRLKLQDIVYLTGRVRESDLPMFYQSADCFILSTKAYEGLGVATLEALATGLPVLGTPVGATKEILSRVDKRLLFESAQSSGIEKGIRWFLKEGIYDEKIPQKARKIIQDYYNWENAGASFEKIIKESIWIHC